MTDTASVTQLVGCLESTVEARNLVIKQLHSYITNSFVQEGATKEEIIAEINKIFTDEFTSIEGGYKLGLPKIILKY